MSFRRASIAQVSTDAGEAIRLTRWWRGYQKGQVARFDTPTANDLKQKRWGVAYHPTRDEKRDDENRVRIQEEGLRLDRRLREAAAAGGIEPAAGA